MDDSETVLETRPPSRSERFYVRLARREFARSIERIEMVAKSLIGSVGAVAGLLLAALQIKPVAGQATLMQLGPFLLWTLSLLTAVLVVFPMRYRHYKDSPRSIQQTLNKVRWRKWCLLVCSTLLFGIGLLWAVCLVST